VYVYNCKWRVNIIIVSIQFILQAHRLHITIFDFGINLIFINMRFVKFNKKNKNCEINIYKKNFNLIIYYI